MVERLLDRFGSLPTPAELRSHARHEPGLMAPTSQMRVLRELEEPSHDEGFAAVERVEFERERRDGGAGVLVAAATLVSPGWQEAVGAIDRDAPHLVFDWLPGGSSDDLAEAVAGLSSIVAGPVEAAVCRARGRAADLLVPAAASRPRARVRAGARRRPRVVDARRHVEHPPLHGRDARCAARARVTAAGGITPPAGPPSRQHTGGVVPVWASPGASKVLGTTDHTDSFSRSTATDGHCTRDPPPCESGGGHAARARGPSGVVSAPIAAGGPSVSPKRKAPRPRGFLGEPTPGLEPGTPSLRVKCSTS